MRKLYIKQRILSLGEKFSVKDEQENEIYFVEGSFMQIPKRFTVMNSERNEVALITKKPLSFLPTFIVDVGRREPVIIKKQFTFLKARYTIDAADLEVHGNWWDMDFELFQGGEVVGHVNKKWFTWGDSYELTIVNDEMESLLIGLVVAIDYVKASQNAAS